MMRSAFLLCFSSLAMVTAAQSGSEKCEILQGEALCLPAEPLCQWCGSKSKLDEGWIHCLANSSATGAGMGPCPFPMANVYAKYGGKVIANTTSARIVEGSYYFPPGDIQMDLFSLHADKTYQCTWKGECVYYNLTLTDGSQLPDAMWSYTTAGMGKCDGHPGCPSAYTCADIVNYGSFDPRVEVVSF